MKAHSFAGALPQIESGQLAVITDIQRFSVHDGPGIRTIVFFKGCPLRCQWCQNPETWNRGPELMYYPDLCLHCGNCVSSCTTGALSLSGSGITINRNFCLHCGACASSCYSDALKIAGQLMSVSEVLETVLRDLVFYQSSGGGLTLSGGECTTYPLFIKSLLQQAKEIGIHTAIETCGFGDYSRYLSILPYLDLILFDIKVPTPHKDIKFTGQSFESIIDNLQHICTFGKAVILRYPMIPGVNDDEQTLHTIARIATKNHISELHILPFHQLGSGKWTALSRNYSCECVQSPSEEQIAHAKSVFEASGLLVNVGGSGE